MKHVYNFTGIWYTLNTLQESIFLVYFNESIRCLNYMYLHYSLLLIVCNYELVIFVSLFQWYEIYICNYISLQFFYIFCYC